MPDKIISVSPHTGGEVDSHMMYLPLPKDFLRTGHQLPFDLYHKTATSALSIYASEGDIFYAHKHTNSAFYIRADQRDHLLVYEEEVIHEILEDSSCEMDVKCHLLQNLTTSLSQKIFENPNASNILHQRKNVSQMVDFALGTPGAIQGLLRVTNHDYYTYTHSVNVGMYAFALALSYFGQASIMELKEISNGYFLHDIGKCRVNSSIINKDGPLDPVEWEEIRKHPSYGYLILKQEGFLTEESRIIVLQHHERMDKRGYPKQIGGSDIHPYSRVCSIADAFDALTTKRSYKQALKPFEALNLMKEEMHAQFDPEIFKHFVHIMSGQPTAI
jgi:HD-GYP domain-containing protein (c-di-GMP phosphodiesterase class II)